MTIGNRTLTKICLVVLILTVFTSNSFGSHKGTITLLNGEKYLDVKFDLNKAYKTIKIFALNKEFNVSYTDVAKIEDQNGNDITYKLLKIRNTQETVENIEKESETEEGSNNGRPEFKSNDNWLSDTERKEKIKASKLWSVMIKVNGNHGFYLADYFEGLTSEIGFGADISIPLNYQSAIRIGIDRIGLKTTDEQLNLLPRLLSPNLEFVERTASSSITMRYFIGAEYYIRSGKRNDGNTIFQVYSGVGAVNIKLDEEIVVFDNSDNSFYALLIEGDDTRFSTMLGIDVSVIVSDFLLVGGAAELDMIYLPENNYAFIFNPKLSVSFLIK